MRIKTKYIVIPCLLLSLIFCGFGITKTLSLFQDAASYEYIIYPYDGRGEVSAYFDSAEPGKGETIKTIAPGETVDLKLSFTNTSAAEIARGVGTVYLGDESFDDCPCDGVASGETLTCDPVSISYNDVKNHFDSNGYCEIRVEFQVERIIGPDGNPVDVSCGKSTAIVYLKKGATP